MSGANARPPPDFSSDATTRRSVRLVLLARALGLESLAFTRDGPRSRRWHGALGWPDTLNLASETSHRLQRLQVARAAVDHEPDGRWSLRISRDDAGDLLGPLGSTDEPDLGIEACLNSWPRPTLLRRLFLRVDGQRVDAVLRQRWPGIERDLPLDPPPAHIGLWPPVDADLANAREALRVAVALHRRLLAKGGHGARATIRSELAALLPSKADPGSDTDEADAPTPTGRFGTPSSASVAAHVTPAPDRQLLAAPPDAPSLSGVSSPVGVVPALESVSPVAPSARMPIRPRASSDGGAGTMHDEWDQHLQAYRRHWATVFTRQVLGVDRQYLSHVRQRHASLARRIRRQFQRSEFNAPVRERRLWDGDRIDLESVMDRWLTLRSGGIGDERVYQNQVPRGRDVSIALLLDLSGSMSFPLASATDAGVEDAAQEFLWCAPPTAAIHSAGPPRRVVDVVKESVVLLCDALAGIGHQFGVFGFNGDGRERVNFLDIKDFSAPWSTTQAAALAAAPAQGATRMGAAVRHAAWRLSQEPARRRMLIVLSDGYPQDKDYGEMPGNDRYGVADTARALVEAERAGIGTFHISIDSAAHDYLRVMCPRHKYRVVREIEALPREMIAFARRLRIG